MVEAEEQDTVLEEKIEELQRQVEELKARRDVPAHEAALARYELNPNEERVLKLLGLGLTQRDASRAVGLSEDYAHGRLQNSADFAKAYSEVKDDFDAWQEARLRFTLPDMWREIDYLMQIDPETYRADGDVDYAKAVLKAKTVALGLVMKHSYTQKSEVAHKHEIDIPMLQVAQDSIALIAEHMAMISAIAPAQLEELLPESKIVDLTPESYALNFNSLVKRDDGSIRCFECGNWYRNLAKHITLKHNMDRKQYIVKHNLDPLEPWDVVKNEPEDSEAA